MTPLVRVKTSEVAHIDSSPPTRIHSLSVQLNIINGRVCASVFLLSVPVMQFHVADGVV